ncbi:hypothetical protein ASPSYDRAFT_574763 [Aspergillus sydowii CBS 593.65]|uniref:Uncharacterized protein n=1 Tax=Aspergillus sydowii CBS 593.65 TaxID=1036612 RepID=A0A1L9SZF3_9EURO|nr:uncharacterized protein ASPSYDRAFT_574763 [Aspergillus sydowii CBS 593.65]OJJ52594.1 hypothetical protein ASPSYDRAFT_574763 [Aspergillus sydowii CBS 593.65]
MGTTSVRRNLFQNHLSRRPVSTSGPSNGSSGLSSQVAQLNASETNSSVAVGSMDDNEIVVKDKNGSYKLEIPVLPPITGDDGDDMEGIEAGGGPGGNPTGATGATSTGQEIEAGLVEMMYRNRNRQMSSEPHEILNLVHQSLANKVATLEEDNWMYETEIDSRA